MVAEELRMGSSLAVIEPITGKSAHPEVFPHAELLSVGDITIGVLDASNPPESQRQEMDVSKYWDGLHTVPQAEQDEAHPVERHRVVRRIASRLSLSNISYETAEPAQAAEPTNAPDEAEHIIPVVLSGNVVINSRSSRRQILAGKLDNIFSRNSRNRTSSVVSANTSASAPEIFGMSRRRAITSAVAMVALIAVASPSIKDIKNTRTHGQTEASVGVSDTTELKYVDTKDELYTPEAQAKRAEMVRVPAGDWVKTNVPTVLKWEDEVVDILSKYKTIHGVPIATNIDSGLVLSFMTTISAGDQFAKNPAETQKGLMGIPDDIGRTYFKNYQAFNPEHSIKAFLAQFSVSLADVYKTGAPDRRTSIKLAILGTDRVKSFIPDKDGAAKLAEVIPDLDNQWTSPTSAAFNRWFADKYVKQFIENAKNSQKEATGKTLSVSKPN